MKACATVDLKEEEKLILLMPYIKKLCNSRWLNFEPEVREAEALLFCICALRSLPVNSGHFLDDLRDTLVPYMDEKNRMAPPRYYGHDCSLDSAIVTNNGKKDWTRYDILHGPELDESRMTVESFITSLPVMQREIIYDLMFGGLSKAAVARKYDLLIYALEKTLLQIGRKYLKGTWQE